MGKESRWSDERVEEVMGNLLRAGISLAAAVVLTGGIFYLIRYHSTSPGYRGIPWGARGPAQRVRHSR